MNWHYTYRFLFHSRFFCKRTYTDGFSANPLIVYFCVSIFQLISSLPTYPSRNVNLTYTYPYLFHSRCFYKHTYTDGLSANPLIVCVFLCKYLSTYLFLIHIPAHKWKLNFYLPLPIPFQILFSQNMEYFYYCSTQNPWV